MLNDMVILSVHYYYHFICKTPVNTCISQVYFVYYILGEHTHTIPPIGFL